MNCHSHHRVLVNPNSKSTRQSHITHVRSSTIHSRQRRHCMQCIAFGPMEACEALLLKLSLRWIWNKSLNPEKWKKCAFLQIHPLKRFTASNERLRISGWSALSRNFSPKTRWYMTINGVLLNKHYSHINSHVNLQWLEALKPRTRIWSKTLLSVEHKMVRIWIMRCCSDSRVSRSDQYFSNRDHQNNGHHTASRRKRKCTVICT